MDLGERKDNRLVSELFDLKLDKENQQNTNEQAKRKSRKMGALRGKCDLEICENFEETPLKKTANDKALVLKSLKSHFTFSTLIQDKEIKEILLQKFKLCKVREGQYLMRQNSMASSFFILHQGKLALQINGLMKRSIEPGEGFGQLALLYSAPRSASIRAMKTSFLWFIDRQTFRSAISSMISKNYKENRSFIDKNEFFRYLTTAQKDRLASIALNQRFEKNSQICKEGQLASSMYILKSGRLSRYRKNLFVGGILKGESFEEYVSLKKGCVRKETIKVSEDSQIMALGIEDIENVLGKSLPIIILRNRAKLALRSSKYLEKLSEDYIERIIDCFKLKNVKQGEIIVSPEELCNKKVFFIAEGQYSISDKSKLGSIYGDSCFGDANSSFRYQIYMKYHGKIAWTTHQDILQSLGCSLSEAIDQSSSIANMLQTHKINKNTIAEMSKTIKLDDLQVIKNLGQGQFGQVLLVTDKGKQHFYALKCISKQQAIKTKLEKHLINEKLSLSTISSPFIMQFIRSFKDDHYIYFLTEFINGIELFDAIRLIGLLAPQQTTFYAAQLVHILQTLHDKSFIYRDLKPENVMVSSDGYLKLIDLGTCKKLKGNEKSFTMIGTPNYMAPEIFAGKGYSFAVDLWSLGIVLFEFMAGFVPFGQESQDPLLIYQQIANNPVKFPKHMKDERLNSLVLTLLNKTPEKRLGGSFMDLKKQPVFQKIFWNDLIGKKLKPFFQVPKDRLVNVQILKSKGKQLKSTLKIPPKAEITRKDLPANWDETF